MRIVEENLKFIRDQALSSLENWWQRVKSRHKNEALRKRDSRIYLILKEKINQTESVKYLIPLNKIIIRSNIMRIVKENCNFGEVVAAIKKGNCAQREGWNSKNMHIYLEDHYSYPVNAGIYKGQTREYEPVICMFNAQGKHQPGWLASQPDILAEDWCILGI